MRVNQQDNWIEPAYQAALGVTDLPRQWHWDEMTQPGGGLRPAWRDLVPHLDAMGQHGLRERWREGERFVEENGVAYNVFGDVQGADRPWPLDPLPFPVPASEWVGIEAAVTQRAQLLNLILADFYGPQRLLRDKRFPASLVLGNPHFLRACHGTVPAADCFLPIYAADLARSPDGQWWVLADRTQGPSGIGYALENRAVSSRILPDMLGECNVRPLAGFFQIYRDAMMRLAPQNRDNPRVALLTPGPFSETYFEHVYLARHLGFTLVEGGDLAVRDARVFVKTLGGLLPVDVLVRRQDDSFCDPLELRSDSMLGVPGLVEAVRAGNVGIANALGSGLTETSTMCAFLPGLCRHLLGEELRMPSVATWWCGEELPFAAVREQIKRLVIKPAFPSFDQLPVFGGKLSATEREGLLDRIKASPERYIAQELVNLSTTPALSAGELTPRRLVLRVYAVATDDGYAVMPGGLTRVSSSRDSLLVTVQSGGGSKDTWVLSDGPMSTYAPTPPPRHAASSADISRATFDLPSRVADNLFWLGRYAERVESAVRLSRALLTRIYSERAPHTAAGIYTTLSAMTGLRYLPEKVLDEKITADDLEEEVLALLHDPTRTSGIGWMVEQLRRLARILRERISADSWRVLYGLFLRFQEAEPATPFRGGNALELLAETTLSLAAFSGLAMESMTRGAGWRFLDIGRRVERALQMEQLLRFGLRFGADNEAACVETLLEIADSAITYRSRYLSSMQADLMLDLLLLDETNPRSVAFQLARLSEHAEHLPAIATGAVLQPETTMLLELTGLLRRVRVEELVERDDSGRRPRLEQALDRQVEVLGELAVSLTRNYLAHATPARVVTTT